MRNTVLLLLPVFVCATTAVDGTWANPQNNTRALVERVVHTSITRGSNKQALDSTSPALVARGDSIFHGKLARGICYTCHGAGARGLPGLAPSLRDSIWLHVDGSYSSLLRIISTGVPRPRNAIAPMLPMGGVRLTPEQIRAVAAYVYSIRVQRT